MKIDSILKHHYNISTGSPEAAKSILKVFVLFQMNARDEDCIVSFIIKR